MALRACPGALVCRRGLRVGFDALSVPERCPSFQTQPALPPTHHPRIRSTACYHACVDAARRDGWGACQLPECGAKGVVAMADGVVERFGELLRRRRRAAGLTQEELAE